MSSAPESTQNDNSTTLSEVATAQSASVEITSKDDEELLKSFAGTFAGKARLSKASTQHIEHGLISGFLK